MPIQYSGVVPKYRDGWLDDDYFDPDDISGIGYPKKGKLKTAE